MSNATLFDATVTTEDEKTAREQDGQKRTTHRAKPVHVDTSGPDAIRPHPEGTRTGPDAIALYREDEVAAAWALVEEAERAAAVVIAGLKANIATLRQQAITIGTTVTGERMRLRWNSPVYDYEFARSVFGDEAIVPRALGRLAPDTTSARLSEQSARPEGRG